jgi:hypothetical protein
LKEASGPPFLVKQLTPEKEMPAICLDNSLYGEQVAASCLTGGRFLKKN